MRKVYELNEDWCFIKDFQEEYLKEDINLDNFKVVSVPHTWNDVDGSCGFEFFRGQCVYRRNVELTAAMVNERVFLEFEGVALESDVYFNGTHLGHHAGGFSTFRYEVTELAKEGENLLVVVADNRYNDAVYPLMADFTFYGGIYRNVNVITTNDIHFNLLDNGSHGVFVKQTAVTDEAAHLDITCDIVSKESVPVRLKAEIFDAEGNLLDYSYKEVNTNEESVISLDVKNPHLWNGMEDPYLHAVVVSIEYFNGVVDSVEIATGLRYFSFDSEKGFFLNGKHMRLNGVSRHQDRDGKGWAINEEDMLEDALLIKELGANSIRLAHYQHSQFFYDLCDQLGFLIWAEIPFISKASVEDLEGTNAISQMKELIKQNYNHASIYCWGIQNEIQIGGDLDSTYETCSKLNDLVHEMDDTRVSTQANVMMVADDSRWNDLTDIIGYNKYFGWYVGKSEDFAWIHEFHKKMPHVKLGISEYGVEGILRYHTDEPKCKDYTEEYHAETHEKIWDIFSQADFLWGTYVWNMFDFGANIRNEGGMKGRNNKGLITYDRKIKKDAYFMYQAAWSKEEVLHICSKRFVNRHNDITNIKVYTNANEVTLYVNGEKVETKANTSVAHNKVVFENVKLSQNTTVEVVSETGKTDFAKFVLVEEAYEDYILPQKEGEEGSAANWFTMPEDVEMPEDGEVVIDPAYFSVEDKLGDLMGNEEVMENVFKKLMPNMAASSAQMAMVAGLPLTQLAQMAPDMFPKQALFMLNSMLQKIKK